MPQASEIEPVGHGVCLWRVYDPSVKAELFSTAVTTASGTCVVDPIPLGPHGISRLASEHVSAIIVTNENHERAAAEFADKFQAPIYVDSQLVSATKLPGPVSIQHGFPNGQVTAIRIEGGPPGEIALLFPDAGGTMVIGDALINFDPYGFSLLPAKYCSNFKLMRRSLSNLLDYSFERMLFAHGTPIMTHARERLELLLKEQR